MTGWGDSGDRDTIRPPLQLGSSDTGRTKAVVRGMARRGAVYESGHAFYREQEYISRCNLKRKIISVWVC